MARIHIATLEDTPLSFSVESFDPTSDPAKWLLASDGESSQQTLRDLADLAEREADLFSSSVPHASSEPAPGPLRRPLHWSVRSLHIAWDAWMHERDIAVPLGLQVTSSEEEMRLMTMYGLLAAAAPSAWAGEYLETCLELEGAPDKAYRITHESGDVRVITGGTPELHGPVHEVLDSLAGRGPKPSAFFGDAKAAVEKLTLLRALAA